MPSISTVDGTTYSFIIHLFLSEWTWFFFFIQWIEICYVSFLILMLKLSYVWPVKVSSSWLLGPFGMCPLFFEHFLNFWLRKILQAYLRPSLPSDETEPFSQGLPGHYVNSWGVPTFGVSFPSAAGCTQGFLPLAQSLLLTKLQFPALSPQQNLNVPTMLALRTISHLDPEWKSLVFVTPTCF